MSALADAGVGRTRPRPEDTFMTTPADTKPEPVTALPDQPSTPSRTRRFGRGLWRVFKWLLILTLVAGVAAAIYFGWPEVNRRFIQPIADNTAELNTLDGRLEDTRAEVADLQARVDSAIEAQGGTPERLASLESQLADITESVDALAGDTQAIDRLVAGHTRRLEALEQTQNLLQQNQEFNAAESSRQITLLRTMELLSRARLFLYQSNFGLAEQDVTTARGLMAELAVTYPDTEPALVDEVVFRLDRTIDQLPERPVAAADDLDIAWSVLVGETAPPDDPGADDSES